ncbi:hypothetical protein A3765_07940 [Oleiphilus sp. HI0130]|nr:hypothetical protein A3765_07940 [Oleiphilus sp. HI0130]KZZ77682.1 hypothetical protein A3767_14740 [Oleiphilus sp. HI0133]
MSKANPENQNAVASGLLRNEVPPQKRAEASRPESEERGVRNIRSRTPNADKKPAFGVKDPAADQDKPPAGSAATLKLKDGPIDEETLHDFATQKRLLASCERVNLVNLQVLSMEGYPDNWSIDSARKTRDLLIMGGSIALGIFIIGLGGLLPAAVSGIALGLSALMMFLAFSTVQSAFTNRPSLTELMSRRQKITRGARGHVAFLEGNGGLAWRCEALGKYNRHLYNQQFTVLLRYSKAGKLAFALQTPRHFRLYLMFMIEAQKAYKKLQAIYLSEGFSLADT